MVELFSDRIIQKIDEASVLYYRLVILVAPAGKGKTVALQEVQKRIDVPLVNVNLELSRLLLDLTERQRKLQLSNSLTEIVEAFTNDVILLDNIELLFDVSLQQDPLRLLQRLSRNKTLVVAWSGYIDNEYLFYATPNHIEYRRYLIKDFLVVNSFVTHE